MKVRSPLSLQRFLARIASLALCLSSAVGTCVAQHAVSASAAASRTPLTFEENCGQTSPQVRFLARTGRYRLFLTDDSTVLEVAGDKVPRTDAVIRTTMLGMNPAAQLRELEEKTSRSNYLIGPETEWKTNIRNFAEVRYEKIYPGIDLEYYGAGEELEYDFSVSPGADVSAIAFKVEGADKIAISKDGSLALQTAAGEVRWRKPVAYQESGAQRKMIEASYRISGNEVRFNVGAYDPRKALVIDPVLAYGTYIDGSNGFDNYVSLAVDDAGFAYVVGYTNSTDFPTTPGAYKRAITNSLNDQIFVSKLNQDGSALVWSTIIGGSGTNNMAFPSGFALDSTGNVYMVGNTSDVTYSTNGTPTYYASTFPTTAHAYNTDHLAAVRYFLLKLNLSGSALDYSTFLSDQPNINGQAVAVDVAGNAYVTGDYNPANGLTAPFPCSKGAYQCKYAGNSDAFVMKFNTQATQLDYATLVGGAQSEDSRQILVDSSGEATIAGATYSTNYPITHNGLRQTDEGGFITSLKADGSGLIYSTVLNHVLQINVKRDTAGNYYAGGSAGTNLPVSANAFQKSFPAVGTQIHLGFLTVIETTGKLLYSSYIAGNPPSTFIEDTQVQLVSLQSVTVAGNRFSDTGFPVTDRAYEQDDCSFVATFNPEASSGAASLVYSGCTPINITDNLVHELFRGVLYFNGARMVLDNNSHLYAMSVAGPTSSNAFQKAPPDPNSGDGQAHVWIGKYNMNQAGPGGINLAGPYQWGPPYSSPVLYRATARSPACKAGIAAMRVYISPGVWANTTAGATLNAYVSFPADGNYNSVIVAYDNCGHAFTMGDGILIQGTSGGTGSIAVTSPVTATVVTSPVHFLANAQVTNCKSGIAAMRIYTAPGVNAYTANTASLDTRLSLASGTYNIVIQAWDNCGHVYQAPETITVH
jgi:hypothetical protein